MGLMRFNSLHLWQTKVLLNREKLGNPTQIRSPLIILMESGTYTLKEIVGRYRWYQSNGLLVPGLRGMLSIRASFSMTNQQGPSSRRRF